MRCLKVRCENESASECEGLRDKGGEMFCDMFRV